jgi:tetratricopeptide (TPR) repeat protein
MVTDNIGFKIKLADILAKRWLALYYLNKKDQADKEIGNFLLTAKPTALISNITTFRVALLQGDTVAMAATYGQFKKFILAWDDSVLNASFYKFHLAVMMFRSKDNIAEAEKMLSQNMAVVPRPRRLHQLGILYAVTGRPEQANDVIKDLLSHENPYDNGITRYYVAKIEAVLGHKEESVEYLRQSIDKGMEFREELFEFDADLKNLFDYPPFIALVTPKE